LPHSFSTAIQPAPSVVDPPVCLPVGSFPSEPGPWSFPDLFRASPKTLSVSLSLSLVLSAYFFSVSRASLDPDTVTPAAGVGDPVTTMPGPDEEALLLPVAPVAGELLLPEAPVPPVGLLLPETPVAPVGLLLPEAPEGLLLPEAPVAPVGALLPEAPVAPVEALEPFIVEDIPVEEEALVGVVLFDEVLLHPDPDGLHFSMPSGTSRSDCLQALKAALHFSLLDV